MSAPLAGPPLDRNDVTLGRGRTIRAALPTSARYAVLA